MLKTVVYSSFMEFRKSFQISERVNENIILYAQEDIKKGRGKTNKVKLYFTTDNLLHEFSSRVCTGNALIENEDKSEIWIENDYYHGESRKTRTYSHYEESKQQLLDFIENSNSLWNHLSELISSSQHVAYIKEMY